jgi:ArsR family transcriptional regulator
MPHLSNVFRALADPTRREILRLLGEGEMRAGDLAERFKMTKPTMSHHFAVLKEADLLSSRRESQTIWYRRNMRGMQDLLAWTTNLCGGDHAQPQEPRNE